jgi:hypothetical protein
MRGIHALDSAKENCVGIPEEVGRAREVQQRKRSKMGRKSFYVN